MKKEEYETFTDKLNLIRSNLSSMAGEWNAYLRGQQDAVKQKFAEYEGENRGSTEPLPGGNGYIGASFPGRSTWQ